MSTTGNARKHRVNFGDNLSSLAALHLGSAKKWPQIAEANGLKHPFRIIVGQTLYIPNSSSSLGPNAPPRCEMPTRQAPPQSNLHQNTTRRSPGAGPAASVSLGLGIAPAALIQYPPLRYKFQQSVQALHFPNGECVIKIDAELDMQKLGAFKIDAGNGEIGFSGEKHNLSLDVNRPFNGNGKMSMKVRSEYGSTLAKIFSEAQFTFDSVTGKALVEFKIGWKFETAEHAFRPPDTHIFTFKPKEISDPPGIKGKIKLVAEVTTREELQFKQTVPLALPLSELSFGMPKLNSQNVIAPAAAAITFWAAFELLKSYGLLALLAL